MRFLLKPVEDFHRIGDPGGTGRDAPTAPYTGQLPDYLRNVKPLAVVTVTIPGGFRRPEVVPARDHGELLQETTVPHPVPYSLP